MQLCILSIFSQEHFKVSAKAIPTKPYMFWVLASSELDNLFMFPHQSSRDQPEHLAAARHSQIPATGLATASGTHTTAQSTEVSKPTLEGQKDA